MQKILIVEDEVPIANLLSMNLRLAGYQCTCVYNGSEAADMIRPDAFDLVLLDVMLPGIDGFSLLEYIRPYDIPVIFITAKVSLNDKVCGLKLGAEDYITKPFETAELLARVETVLRRCKRSGGDGVYRIENVTVDTNSRLVTLGGCTVELTMKEYELLLLFLKNKNIALYREIIYERVWGSDYMGDTRTVDLHVQRLRKKLHWEKKIESVYKVGYRFTC